MEHDTHICNTTFSGVAQKWYVPVWMALAKRPDLEKPHSFKDITEVGAAQ